MEGKKTRGRQKIEMKRIENEEERLVTFSKRRSGIYKKACELVILTGAELAIVVFSPKGKPFSFAHPSVETIANRFLGKEQPPDDGLSTIMDAYKKNKINELAEQHNQLVLQLEEKKKTAEILKQKTKGLDMKGWWNAPIEGLNEQELHKMELAFKELCDSIYEKIRERTGASSSSSPALTAPPPSVIMNPFDSSSNPSDVTNPLMSPPLDNGHAHLSFEAQPSLFPSALTPFPPNSNEANIFFPHGLDANKDWKI